MTPWFSALTDPPHRVGWYLCRNSAHPADAACSHLRYWSGKCWLGNGPRSHRTAFGMWSTANQWRGLTQPATQTVCTNEQKRGTA